MKMDDSYILYTEKLNDENRQIFEKIEFYVSVILRQYYYRDTEELLNDIFDSIITAQENGKPVRDVIGDNLVVFCENICSEFKSASRFKQLFKRLNQIAITVFLLSVIQLTDKQSTILKSALPYLPVVFPTAYLEEFMFSKWFRSYFRKYSKTFKIKTVKIVECFSIGTFVAFTTSMGLPPDYALNPWIPFCLSISYLILYQLVNRREFTLWQKNRVDLADLSKGTLMKKQLEAAAQKWFIIITSALLLSVMGYLVVSVIMNG